MGAGAVWAAAVMAGVHRAAAVQAAMNARGVKKKNPPEKGINNLDMRGVQGNSFLIGVFCLFPGE